MAKRVAYSVDTKNKYVEMKYRDNILQTSDAGNTAKLK